MKTQRGFSLIELMIVVAIIAVLAAIAIPNYGEHVTRSRIIDALANLSEMRSRMEQHFNDRRSYATTCVKGTPGSASEVRMPPDSDLFVYTCPTAAADQYVLRAQGQGRMAGFRFEINHLGVKTTTLSGGAASGWSGSGKSCWVTSKSGSC